MFASKYTQTCAVPVFSGKRTQHFSDEFFEQIGQRTGHTSAAKSIPQLISALTDVLSGLREDLISQGKKLEIALITQYYAMSTLRLSYAFIDLCETKVHTLKAVFHQGKALMTKYEALQEAQKDQPIAFHHYCVVYNRPNWMEGSSYPDVAYCAAEPERKRCKLAADNEEICASDDCNSSTLEENSDFTWLQINSELWDEVMKKWSNTFHLRIINDSSKTVNEMFGIWPILKVLRSYMLASFETSNRRKRSLSTKRYNII